MQLLNTLPDVLAHHAGTRPHDVAFIDGDETVTFEQFSQLCNRTAAWLAAQGVAPGDRVAVWLVNRIEWLALYIGLSHIGATLVTVNTRYRSHELEYILERSRASMLVLELNFRKIDFAGVLAGVDPQAAKTLRRVVVLNPEEAVPETILGKPTVAFRLASLPPHRVPATGTADALNILFTTSGTTSGPKLVMHSQRTVAVHSQRVAQSYGFEQPETRLLASLPFCGVFGFNAVFAAFAAGKPSVIMDTFDGPEAARLINRHHITHLFGSDEMFRRILDYGVGETPFPSARVFGFASFHPRMDAFGREAWRRGVPLFGLYGSSEVQALFSISRESFAMSERLKGGGLPANSAAQIRIRDIDTGEILPVGQSGAIEINSDTNFIGYLDNPDETRKVIDAGGFFHTGDIGYLREDGSFVYVARQGDAIRLSGYLVSPTEIEDVLKAQHGVANAQVVAVEVDGQVRCAAFVIAEQGAVQQEAALKAAVAATLAPFKVPVRIWSVAEFPVTQSSNGAKIQRGKLREMAAQRIKEAE